jgi:hypothetical protein
VTRAQAGGQLPRLASWIAAALIVVAPAFAGELPLRLVSITAPVHPGGSVTLVIATQPGATCSGARQGHFGNDYAIALRPQVAGSDGSAQWQWSVLNGKRPIGRRGVHVTCTSAGQSAALDTAFDVE